MPPPAGVSGPGLAPVDRLELTTLVDNTIDVLLPSTPVVRRAPRDSVLGGPKSRLRAEHGFSTLVTVERQGRRRAVLFDAGLTPEVPTGRAARDGGLRCRAGSRRRR